MALVSGGPAACSRWTGHTGGGPRKAAWGAGDRRVRCGRRRLATRARRVLWCVIKVSPVTPTPFSVSDDHVRSKLATNQTKTSLRLNTNRGPSSQPTDTSFRFLIGTLVGIECLGIFTHRDQLSTN